MRYVPKNVILLYLYVFILFRHRTGEVVFIELGLKTQQMFAYSHFGSSFTYDNLNGNLVDIFPREGVFDIESFKLRRIFTTNYLMHAHIPRPLDAKRILHRIKLSILISILDMNLKPHYGSM